MLVPVPVKVKALKEMVLWTTWRGNTAHRAAAADAELSHCRELLSAPAAETAAAAAVCVS